MKELGTVFKTYYNLYTFPKLRDYSLHIYSVPANLLEGTLWNGVISLSCSI